MSVKAISKKASCHFSPTKRLSKINANKIPQNILRERFQELALDELRFDIQARSTSNQLVNKFIEKLSNAVYANDIDRMKTLIQQAFRDRIHIGDLTDDVLARFGKRKEAQNGCKSLENITKTALIKIGILQTNPETFDCNFIENVNLQKDSEKSILNAIDELIADSDHYEKKHYFERLKAEINAVLRIDKKRHQLDALDVLKICLKVEKLFQSQKTMQDNLYLRKSETDLPRAVVVNFKKRIFTILSKKHGALQASGGFKKVTDAISVHLTENSATAKRMVRAVNKFEKKIYSSELSYEREYGHNDAIFSYPAKRDPTVLKTNLIQEAYDSDLYIYTGNVSKDIRKKMPVNDIVSILIAVGDSIAKMHENGDVHRDLKAKNVLFRRNDDGTISVKVCDFGHANTPINEMVSDRNPKVHGTLRYTPPEVLVDYPDEFNPFEQQKAIDMYGLGSLIYELVTLKKTPWGHDVYVALKETGKSAHESTKKALSLQKSVPHELLEKNAPPHENCRQALLYLAGRLLDPDPILRMKIDEFQTELHTIKTKFEKKP